MAKSLALSNEKLPEIWALPDGIASLITGADITYLSKTIANLLPTFLAVKSANFLEPILSNLIETMGLLNWSTEAFASTKLSPLTPILF